MAPRSLRTTEIKTELLRRDASYCEFKLVHDEPVNSRHLHFNFHHENDLKSNDFLNSYIFIWIWRPRRQGVMMVRRMSMAVHARLFEHGRKWVELLGRPDVAVVLVYQSRSAARH